MVEFKCKHCGLCCSAIYRHEATFSDLDRWISEERVDILSELLFRKYDNVVFTAWMWKDHKTGGYLEGDCPFLYKSEGKYYCKIQETKPDVCRTTIFTKEQAKKFGCKGYN